VVIQRLKGSRIELTFRAENDARCYAVALLSGADPAAVKKFLKEVREKERLG